MRRILILLLLLMICIVPASAFGDTVQRYDADLNEVWSLVLQPSGTGSISTVNSPSSYSTSQSVCVVRYNNGATGSSFAKTDSYFSSSYFAFTVNNLYSSSASFDMRIQIYNSTDNLLFEINIPEGDSYHDGNRYEFVHSGTSLIMYIDGVEIRQVATFENQLISVGVGVWGGQNLFNYYVYFDDFSTSSILGMNLDWTQAATNIDMSYGIQSMNSFSTADYSVEVSNVATGTVINTTQLGTGSTGDPAGFVRWDRNDIFGSNFGLYKVQLLRDSEVLTSTKFSVFDTTLQASVDWGADSYSVDDSGSVTYSITNADFSTYLYTLNYVDNAGQGSSTNLISDSGTVIEDLSSYFVGTAYAILSRTHKTTGASADIAYDTVSITAAGPPIEDSISVSASEYYFDDQVGVTYSHGQSGYILVQHAATGITYHLSNGFIGSGENQSWSFYVPESDPTGLYYVYLMASDNSLKAYASYTITPSASATSYIDVVQGIVDLYDSVDIAYRTVNSSILTVEDPDGVVVYSDTVNSSTVEYITYVPSVKSGPYTVYLYDDSTISDTFWAYFVDAPDVPNTDPNPVTNETIIEDVIDEDETMNEYFDGKFREFAPSAWGIFLLAIVLWLVSILSSFGGSGGKRRR